MHPDMHPLAPLATGNALLDAISIRALYLACVAAGVAGVLAWTARKARRRA